jgi:adenine/guanine phosphoribosyltransferase-like PRPP-binding protein
MSCCTFHQLTKLPARYVPLGYSRKFWYDDKLSAGVSSITSPGQQKRVYLDPRLLPLVKGKRVIIIDDAVSTGGTVKTIWDMLEGDEIGADVVACGVVMRQGSKWREVLGEERAAKVLGVFESPLLEACEGGWKVRA